MADANISRRGFFGHAAGAYTLMSTVTVGAVVMTDPMAMLIGDINTRWERAETMSGDADQSAYEEYTVEVMAPLWHKLYRATPETTSITGAAEALRYLIRLGDLSAEDEAVVSSVVTFLELQVS